MTLDKLATWWFKRNFSHRGEFTPGGVSPEGREAYAFAYAFLKDFGQAGVIDDIAAERQRQISAEGWTPSHDDEHGDGSMAAAAAAYAWNAIAGYDGLHLWPWETESWNPKGGRRDLIRAGALIVAEIERLDRASGRPAGAIQLSNGEWAVAVCPLCDSSNRPELVAKGEYICPGYKNNPCPIEPAAR